MAKTPKTLQVSFGGFSCTLEGFDDPVEAMKAVTEYLRGLCARDPDFAARIGLPGAPLRAQPPVPPTPPGPPPPAAAAMPPTPPPPPESILRVPADPEPPAVAEVAPPEVNEPQAPPPAAEAEDGEAAPGDHDPAADVPVPDPAARPGLSKLLAASAEGEEEELTRFMSRADDQLADPEAARRRGVIAQLKAAVAATEAERALGEPDPAPQARQGAFRLDLSEAVRSQPPGPGRPEQTPLRLVESQRVDAPTEDDPDSEQADDEDVLPVRRPGSFRAFASEMSASSLPDLLEAAAAWLCFVDERESVSRAQLMALASEALEHPPEREEGLRAFGTLLREGQVVAVTGGRYRVSDGSRFHPARLAG